MGGWLLLAGFCSASADPEPIFGLAGRVFNAMFSGEHNKEPKDKEPTDQYGAPSNSYGAPSDSYGAPVDSYGAPDCACRRTFGNKDKDKDNKDKDKEPCDCYGAPSYEYGAPSSGYGAPSSGYGAPSTGYGAPSSSYVATQNSFGAQKPSYKEPQSSYGSPKPSYEAPQPSYGAPKPSYEAPQSPFLAYPSLLTNKLNPHMAQFPIITVPSTVQNHREFKTRMSTITTTTKENNQMDTQEKTLQMKQVSFYKIQIKLKGKQKTSLDPSQI